MLFAPYTTDAPVYHWPRATITLIVVNLLLFLLLAGGVFGDAEQFVARFGLPYGDGPTPVRWLTSCFLHAGLIHVVGNMLILWPLGLIVEGKTGWKLFTVIYLGLGVLASAIEQALFRNADGVSLGASSIVFGLLAIALVWAPRNDLVIGYWVPALGVGTFELSILLFACIALAMQVVIVLTAGFPAGGAMFVVHLLGFLLGGAVGTALWARGIVDCEGWDLYSVIRGRNRPPAPSSHIIDAINEPVSPAREKHTPRRRCTDTDRGIVKLKAKTIRRVRAHLDDDAPLEALQALDEARHLIVGWSLPDTDQLRLGSALSESGHWPEAIRIWEDYLSRHPSGSDAIRIEAAEAMLKHQERPHAALRVVNVLDRADLHPDLARRCASLDAEARRLIDAGIVEFESPLGS